LTYSGTTALAGQPAAIAPAAIGQMYL